VLPLAPLLAGLTVVLQIGYPLTVGATRDRLTIATVLAFLAATLTHSWTTHGPRWTAGYLGLTIAVAGTAEAVGVATGLPFGDYAYGDRLGPSLLDVPLLVPLAWAMFAYPCLLVGRRLGRPVLVGAAALVGWDLFLDPQMVDAGHWTWLDVQHHLPGVPDVPLSNLFGWTLVSLLLMAALRTLPDRRAPDGLPLLLLTWTWASSVLANLAFFGRPAVAVYGGLALGAIVALSWRAP
jgi:hypothetical protein